MSLSWYGRLSIRSVLRPGFAREEWRLLIKPIPRMTLSYTSTIDRESYQTWSRWFACTRFRTIAYLIMQNSRLMVTCRYRDWTNGLYVYIPSTIEIKPNNLSDLRLYRSDMQTDLNLIGGVFVFSQNGLITIMVDVYNLVELIKRSFAWSTSRNQKEEIASNFIWFHFAPELRICYRVHAII